MKVVETIVWRRKRLAWLLLCLLLGAVVLAVACTKPSPAPIKIGAIISLTGPGAYLTELRDALLMAAEEINGDGGINGHPIELYIEDSKTDPEEAKKAMARLEAEHHPVLYISTLSAISMALAPQAENMQVPLIGLVTSAQEFTEGKKWVFRYYATASGEVAPAISILQKLGVKKLGVLYQNESFGQSVFKLVSAAFEAEGGRVVGQHFDKQDFNVADKVVALGAVDAIYVVGYVSFTGKVVQQVRLAGFRREIIAASGGAAPSVRAVSETEGVYLSAPLLYNENYLYAKKLSDKYVEKFHRPLSHQSAVGYDVLYLLRGLLQDEPVSRVNLKKVLEQGYHFPSAMGDIIVAPGSHEINYPLYPALIKDGAVNFGG